MGFGYHGKSKVVCWKMEVINGVISGIGYSGGDHGVISGTVNAEGQASITAIMTGVGATRINIVGTFLGKVFKGTWEDGEGNGTISGNKVTASAVSKYNGKYSGYAYDGKERLGSWRININNGFISPIRTSGDDSGAISGIVDGQAEIIAMTVVRGEGEGEGGEDESINISATITGNTITGTWTNAITSEHGTMTGNKE